jgi:hypothetical protein
MDDDQFSRLHLIGDFFTSLGEKLNNGWCSADRKRFLTKEDYVKSKIDDITDFLMRAKEHTHSYSVTNDEGYVFENRTSECW